MRSKTWDERVAGVARDINILCVSEDFDFSQYTLEDSWIVYESKDREFTLRVDDTPFFDVIMMYEISYKGRALATEVDIYSMSKELVRDVYSLRSSNGLQ